jgi:hypothetical protein
MSACPYKAGTMLLLICKRSKYRGLPEEVVRNVVLFDDVFRIERYNVA